MCQGRRVTARAAWLTGTMSEEFEGDLSESVFWGANLQRSLFRDADLSSATFFHTLWREVSIDGVIDRLIVNGVDVTDFVNANDRWYPLRNRLEPTTADDLRDAWAMLSGELVAFRERVAALDPAVTLQSVNGEWSLRDTLRHLVFAFDKWFTWPILGERAFTSIGLPNTGSKDLEWPGLDPNADPDVESVRRVHLDHIERFTRYLEHIDLDALPEAVEVLENGTVPTLMCFHVVLEEHFEHLRYALRDLDTIVGT